MASVAAIVITVTILVSLGGAAVGIVRWARRTGRRRWLWLLGAYVAANVLWAILRPLIARP
jgi:hypothetical protein